MLLVRLSINLLWRRKKGKRQLRRPTPRWNGGLQGWREPHSLRAGRTLGYDGRQRFFGTLNSHLDDAKEISLMIGIRPIRLAALFLAAGLAVAEPAFAAVQSYIHIPSIVGEDSTPGYPGAMSVQSLTITPNTLTVTKEIDLASPAIFAAALGGTPLGTVKTLLYNGAPAGQPDATLYFFDGLVSSYQALNGTTEEVSFNADNPLELYLEVPGIPGANNTPGHPNVLQIQSFTLTGNDFTIVKLQDSASDDLFLATLQGTHFANARLLLYDSLPLGNSPAALIDFHDLLISSSQVVSDPVRPLEQHTFNFEALSQRLPEPTSLALLSIGAAFINGARRRGRGAL
jgi:type VI protein secretion system component Hcp